MNDLESRRSDAPLPAVYARVSTEEQAQSGTSLPTQIQSLSEAVRSEGKPEPLVFVDEGQSGATPHRPGLMALEAAIAEGKVSEVRVSALDRLARDLILQETLINRWLASGLGFHSTKEPDLGSSDPTRILVRQVLGAIAQYERAVITGRMMAGRIARAHQGYWPAGKVPFGYTLEGQPSSVVLVPERADIVRQAGLRAIAGESVTSIAEDFNRRKIKGPGGNGWDPGYLARMLRNPVYKGEARFFVRESVEPKTRRTTKHAIKETKNGARFRPEDDWILIEVPHVFSTSEWEAIQAAITKRLPQRNQSGEYLLSRRFKSACGATYVGNYNNGKPRYLCLNRTKRKIKGIANCGCPQVMAGWIEDAVWTSVAAILKDPDRLMSMAREELSRRGILQSEPKLKKTVEAIDRKLVRAREATARIVRFHAQAGTLDDTTFQMAVGPLNGEVQKLESERVRVLSLSPESRWHSDRAAISQVAAEVHQRLDKLTYEEKVRLLALLDVRVTTEPDGQLKGRMAAPINAVTDDPPKVRSSTFSQFRPDKYLSKRYLVHPRGDDGLALKFALSLTRGSWSRRHESCQECGTIERPHQGNGLCGLCFSRAYSSRRINVKDALSRPRG